MFLKAALAFLAVGVLSVNALTVPVARSPAPEPECEFPQLFSIAPYHDLTLVSFNSPRTRGLDAQARSFVRPVATRGPQLKGRQEESAFPTRQARHPHPPDQQGYDLHGKNFTIPD